jgi:hypothetical protein
LGAEKLAEEVEISESVPRAGGGEIGGMLWYRGKMGNTINEECGY